MEAKTFKGALQSKVNHSKRLEVISQREILASQDFDRGRKSTYRVTPSCFVSPNINQQYTNYIRKR